MKGKWVRISRNTKDRTGKVVLPKGLIGLVFWSGSDNWGNEKLGLDLNGNYGEGVFVHADRVVEVSFITGKTVDEDHADALAEDRARGDEAMILAHEEAEERSAEFQAMLSERIVEPDIEYSSWLDSLDDDLRAQDAAGLFGQPS